MKYMVDAEGLEQKGKFAGVRGLRKRSGVQAYELNETGCKKSGLSLKNKVGYKARQCRKVPQGREGVYGNMQEYIR